jgi:hypothetical protein
MTNATLSILMLCNNMGANLDRITNQAAGLVKADPDQSALSEVTTALATVQTKLAAAQAAISTPAQPGQ